MFPSVIQALTVWRALPVIYRHNVAGMVLMGLPFF